MKFHIDFKLTVWKNVVYLASSVWSADLIDTIHGRYEQDGKAKRVVKAQQLWYAIIESQTETGTPYMLYKDACNRKSNQQNLGTIKCSNLCTEVVEYTSKDEVRNHLNNKEQHLPPHTS